jgi:hypothetical protein
MLFQPAHDIIPLTLGDFPIRGLINSLSDVDGFGGLGPSLFPITVTIAILLSLL